MKHLWDIHHPYYGADGCCEPADSFDELRQIIDDSNKDLNVVYRWDWVDLSDSVHDGQGYTAEERKPTFKVYLLCPRRAGFWSLSCPISREQEPEVLEWLRGPRVLGYLRTLWAPLLDADEQIASAIAEALRQAASELDPPTDPDDDTLGARDVAWRNSLRERASRIERAAGDLT